MFKKNKITLYTVRSFDNPLKIWCITTTKAEAEEYINKKLIIENMQDFESWCFYHQIKNEDKSSAWVKYFNTRLPKEEKLKYRYYKTQYKNYEIASILRLFTNCESLDCSFEAPFEKSYQEQKMSLYKKFAEKVFESVANQAPEDFEESKKDPENIVQ